MRAPFVVLLVVASFVAGYAIAKLTAFPVPGLRARDAAVEQRAAPPVPGDEAARAAISALSDLRGATKVGVTQSDYQRRVTDTGVVIDRHVGRITTPGVHDAVAASFRYYVLATIAFRGGGDADMLAQLERNPDLERCDALRRFVVLEKNKSTPTRGDLAAAVVQGGGLRELWSCGADKLDEAEKLLAR